MFNNVGMRTAVLWKRKLHDGIGFDAASGRAYAQAPDGALTTGFLTDLFTFTGDSKSKYMGSAGLLIPSVTNTPRIEYDINGNLLGLLIEGSRTNLNVQSEDLGTTWVTANITVTTNQTNAPDGNLTADQVNATATGHNINMPCTVAASTAYVFSFYAKRGTATDLKYSVFDSSHAADIIAPTSYFSSTNATGWTRISVPFTTPVGCTGVRVYPMRDSGVTGTAFFWGAQVEVGPSASSYIPTVASSVTRAAETCARTLGAELSATLSAMFVQFDVSSGTPISGAIAAVVDDGSTSNYGALYATAADNAHWVGELKTSGVAKTVTLNTATSSNKGAMAWASNDLQAAYNGVLGTPISSLTVPTVTTLRLGYDSGTAHHLYGHIKKFDYYPARISNAQLQQLTS